MHSAAGARFELKRMTTNEWVIRDHRYEATDARHAVAYVWEIDPGECELVWLRDMGLPRWYESPIAALEDVQATSSRATAPIPIAHRPPPLATAG